MVTTYALPNGSTVTQTALTVDEIQGALHDLTLQLFGTALPQPGQPDPATNPIRVGWQTTGSPDWLITQDITFLTAVPDSLPQYLIRDVAISTVGEVSTSTQSYMRRWTATWVLYGPNATQRAYLLHGLMLSEFSRSVLQGLGLGIDPTFSVPTRVPELYDQQWWERSDFSIAMTERVRSAVTVGTVAIVPIVVAIEGDQYAGYGSRGYGEGQYGAEYVPEVTTTNVTATAEGT